MLPTWPGSVPQPSDHQSDTHPTEPPRPVTMKLLDCELTWVYAIIRSNTIFAIFMPRHQKSGGVLCYTLWNFECPSVCTPTIRLPATPPIVLGQSLQALLGWSEDMHIVFFRILKLFFFHIFFIFNLDFFRLKICILFFQNPEIIFYHIFFNFNLDFFRALILQKCIGSMYLLPATPSTVLGQSFSNFTGAFSMVWRYAYCFFRILKFFLSHFFFIFNLDFFWALILQKCIESMYLVRATPPTVLG